MTSHNDTASSAHLHREFWREAVTMALYLSLSLLAVLLATPSNTEDPLGPLLLTAIGLLVAHLLAFTISSRLVSQGVLDRQAQLVAAAQIVGGLVVVALAIAPLLILSPPSSLRVSEGLMLALVAYVGFTAARQANVSRGRALIYVALVVASALCVLVLKALAGH